MPKLIRLYITQVIWGFVISAVFVGASGVERGQSAQPDLGIGCRLDCIGHDLVHERDRLCWRPVRLQDHEHG